MTLKKVSNAKADHVRLSDLGNARHYLTPFKRVHTNIKQRNKKLKFDTILTYKELLPLMHLTDCHYCLTPLNRIPHGQKSGTTFLDRKDNEKGYEVDNLVPCCWRCNNGRGNLFSYEEWYGMTEYLRR